MKTKITIIILFFALKINAQIGISANGAMPAESAMLDISSTSKGFLPPRLTIAQRNSITNPAVGLVIFCTDCDELQLYNGTTWKAMIGTAACSTPIPPSLLICNQTWMVKNLDVTTYRNGAIIPEVTDPIIWANLTIGAWCYLNNDPANGPIYGKLYNWYAVNDPRGLAPQGWHVPIDAEFTTLSTCLGGGVVAGGKMKETGTSNWATPNTAATNSSGFTGLPGRFRRTNGDFLVGNNNVGYWWSNTLNASSQGVVRRLDYNVGNIIEQAIPLNWGLSVRALKD